MGTVAKLNDVLCGSISKVDDVLKANASKWDDNTFCSQNCIEGNIDTFTNYSYKDCCYPYAQITGNTGGDKLNICFDTTGYRSGVQAVSPTVVCQYSALTSCCEIQLGYEEIFVDPCAAVQSTYYISTSCLATSCDLSGAFAIYTDEYCTAIADDGYYSDGISYGTQSSGVFTFDNPC